MLVYCLNTLAQEPVIIPGESKQDEETSEPEELDISDKNLDKLYKLQDFYLSQQKKRKIPGTLMEKYNTELTKVEKEIQMIQDKRIAYAKKVSLTDPTLLEAEKFNFQFRDMDLALGANESPIIYANEIGSWVFTGGVSFIPIDFDEDSINLWKYSTPFTVSGERVLNEWLSIGGYIGHFIEKIRSYKTYEDTNQYFSSSTKNYKHSYITAGGKASFHLFNPISKLNAIKFDPYISVMAGYTLSAATIPFLNNEKYLSYDEAGNPNGKYSDPKRSGLHYGAFAGIKYMYDDNLGFFIEAGYSNTGFVTAGVCLRFLGKNLSASIDTDVIEFKVQIASSERKIKAGSKRFKGAEGIEEYVGKNIHIYTLMNAKSYIRLLRIHSDYFNIYLNTIVESVNSVFSDEPPS